ncbi:MAG TPA: hypothetical protein PK825_01865 [Bacteroidales bacterium]|nr:hypothetical protein [Bacteroidales bacterium]
MKHLTVRVDREGIWLQGRALWDSDCDTISALEGLPGEIKEIHIDIEYMSCRFSRALYAFLSRLEKANVYWHLRDAFDVHADLPKLYSEVLGLPIQCIPGNTLVLA